MKGLKKLLSGILTTAMVVSTMATTATTAFAANPTIDTNKDVSLTIYTYGYDEESENRGTGVIGDKEKVPEGAELLNGVTFRAYKVADIQQTENEITYNTVDIIKSDVGATIAGGMTAADIKAKFTDSVLNKLVYIEKTTATINGEDGVAKFTSTDLSGTGRGQGLYLVVETDAPDTVTEKIDPFLVSLPMTNAEGDDWLYDVYAFPKNSTARGQIILKKYGVTGNGNSTAVTGAKFVLQKKEGSTWVTQTTDTNGESIGDNGVITMTDTKIKVNGLAQGEYRFIETSAPDNTYILDGEKAYEFTIDSEGIVKVNGTTTSTIEVMNYKPEIEKEVLVKNGDPNKESDWQKAVDYSVGDHVPFKVSSTVPNNIDRLKHYVLVDSMSSGLTMDSTDQASFVVSYYSGSTKITDTGITTMPSYNASTNKWTLDLSQDVAKLKNKNITEVQVTFTATLNQNAVTAETGNPNTVGLEYTNKIYPIAENGTGNDGNPNIPPTGEDQPYEETYTITDKVVVYTFGLELIKTFSGAAPSSTIKASFDLYRPLVPGETKETTLKISGNTVDVKKVGSYTTDENGKILINTSRTGDADKAFSNGTYYFVETATASGYNLLKEPVAVKIQLYYDQTFKTTTTTTKYDKNGNVIGTPEVTATGSDTTTYYTDAGKAKETTVTTTSISIVNNKGFNLPTTGGKGTILFTIIGLGMMAAAVIVFFGARRKKMVR